MINGQIYLIRNTVNGKGYVGQTIKGEGRVKNHFRWALNGHGKSPLARAIRLHGEAAFTREFIDSAMTHRELDERETYWIKKLGTKVPHGYNLTDGGGGSSGWVPTKKTRAKISAAVSGENNPMKRPEVRAQCRATMARPEVKAKFSGDNHPMKRPEVRARHRVAMVKISGKNNPRWKGETKIQHGYLFIRRFDLNLSPDGFVPAHNLNWVKRYGSISVGKRVHFKDKTLKMVDGYGRRYRDPSVKNLYLY